MTTMQRLNLSHTPPPYSSSQKAAAIFGVAAAVLFAAPLAILAIVAQATTARTRAFRASAAWDKHPLSLSLSLYK